MKLKHVICVWLKEPVYYYQQDANLSSTCQYMVAYDSEDG